MIATVGRIVAAPARELGARIVRRTPLVYESPAGVEDDRPPFVRAASGISFLGRELCVVQDDASFLAIGVPPGPMRSIPLPADSKGRRRFEERLGNKLNKLDLEVCVAAFGRRAQRIVAFGSGSLKAREMIVVYEPGTDPAPRLVDGVALYDSLRSERDFAGGALNLEGAVIVEGVLRLFQRGNGRQIDGLPVPSTVDLDAGAFLAWIDESRDAPPPLGTIRQFDLGQAGGARYGFTDAAVAPSGRIAFLSSAEHSPDTVRDGEVVGTRVGIITHDGAVFTDLLDERGDSAALKAEGLAFDPVTRDRAWVVLDPDDPDAPAELCEVELAGAW